LLYLRRIKGLNSSWRIIDFSLRHYAQKTFLIQPDKNLKLTFKDFKERIEKQIAYFSDAGLTKGDVLAFSSANSIEYFEVRAACHCLGIVFLGLPINLTQEDIKYFLNRAGAKAIFKEGRLEIIKGIARRENLSDVATLNLSSGTTQKTPKIVRLTENNWIESLYGYLSNSRFNPHKKIIFLSTLPLITAGSTTFLPAFLAGITYVIIKEDTPVNALAGYINEYRVNRLYITPSRLLELLEWAKQHNQQLSSLDDIITGTERIAPNILKAAISFFGPKIFVGYGMVEALPPITMLTPEDYHTLGSAGRASKGVKIKILNDGRIAIKSKTVSAGYLDNPEENLKCFKQGWFYTNDYGLLDKNGYLYILGRKEDILTEEPRRIFSPEIEDKIYELPFIKQCAVIKKNGRFVLFVSLREELSPQEGKDKIAGFCKENLKGLLVPDVIIIKDTLPVNYLGKLDRKRLREEIKS
jgi:long-chain acyl-CoA synthetase